MALSQNLRGIAAILVATGSFVANDTCMKLALADAPPFQVLVMSGIAAIIWCLPVIYGLGLIRELPRAFHPWVLLRSGCELMAILAFITALAHMPIADLTAIAQISPLVVLLGMWVSKLRRCVDTWRNVYECVLRAILAFEGYVAGCPPDVLRALCGLYSAPGSRCS